MAESNRKPILIAGGGVSALLLAQALLRASIPFLVFEKDSSISFRAQGYRLRMSPEGLAAVESALGPEKFPRFWDTCGKTGGVAGFSTINALTGEEITPEPRPTDSKPEDDKKDGISALASRDGKIVGIARGDMRQIFLDGCEPFVKWSHSVTGYEVTSSGVHAIFADGTKSVEGDLLIGGEGIHSHVAQQLSGGLIKTFDTGARGIHGQAPTTAFKGLGEGVFMLIDESRAKGRVGVITNVRPKDMDDPTVKFGWTMNAQPGLIQAPNDDYSIIGHAAAAIAKDLTTNWHPRFKTLFSEMDDREAAFWKITCSTPTGVPEWQNERRVTVIGDAAHSMTPAAGNGANTALRDSALLGRLLAEAGGFQPQITQAYETEMRVYASEAVRNSYGLAKKQFGINIDENSKVVRV